MTKVEWFSSSDKYPENHKVVLALHTNGSWKLVWKSNSSDYWYDADTGKQFGTPTHWCYLPERPEGV